MMWQRDTSRDCSDEDEGSSTLTDGSTSYNITGLEEDSTYIITVMAMNSNDMATSNNITGMTQEAGKDNNNICMKSLFYEMHLFLIFCICIQLRLLLPHL